MCAVDRLVRVVSSLGLLGDGEERAIALSWPRAAEARRLMDDDAFDQTLPKPSPRTDRTEGSVSAPLGEQHARGKDAIGLREDCDSGSLGRRCGFVRAVCWTVQVPC